jgi:hypothetical protein
MSERIVERADGRYIVRTTGPGKSSWTRLSGGGGDIIRPGGTATVIDRGRASRPRAVARPLARVDSRSDDIEFREHARPEFVVKLDLGARVKIKDELDRVRFHVGLDAEAGAWLCAHRQAQLGEHEQEICTTALTGTTWHSSMHIELSDPLETQRAIPPHMSLIGDWHSHLLSDDPRPSRDDMAGWLAAADRWVEPRWIGIIVTRRDGLGWDFHGWVVRREWTTPTRRPVCEPAIVRKV